MVSPGNRRRNYNSHSLNMPAAVPAQEYTPLWIITPSIRPNRELSCRSGAKDGCLLTVTNGDGRGTDEGSIRRVSPKLPKRLSTNVKTESESAQQNPEVFPETSNPRSEQGNAGVR
jgi:hypothetical protein